MGQIRPGIRGRTRQLFALLGLLWILVSAGVLYFEILIRPSITITWTTQSEVQTAGYNVLRRLDEQPELIRLNEVLIPSQADSLAGGTYQYTDNDVTAGVEYEYVLEDVEFDGTVTRHEPIAAGIGKPNLTAVLLAVASASVGIGLIAYSVRYEH